MSMTTMGIMAYMGIMASMGTFSTMGILASMSLSMVVLMLHSTHYHSKAHQQLKQN
jgi:uncharacterized membrane protein